MALFAFAPLLLALGTCAPCDEERDRAEFEQKERIVHYEAGQRHLELGLWCREKGLTTQAAAELVLAEELSHGKNPGARTVLSLMRRYDDDFWKKGRKGSAASRKSYETKAAKARREDQEERLELAEWAWRKKLPEESLATYRGLLTDLKKPLELDAEGSIQLEFGAIPKDASEVIAKGAIDINGRLYLRDAFLESLPDVGAIHEVDAEGLRVRSPISLELAEGLHALGLALLPQLETELGARPARKLDLFVFATRASYDGWLASAGYSDHKVGTGLADPLSFTALVCAEGLERGVIDAVALHELTHLFWYGMTPSVMPDWFNEGLAETFGGAETFTWDGTTLALKGKLGAQKLATLRAAGGLFPLADLLRGNANALLNQNRALGELFYAESWAFLRFLREAADPGLREEFERWVAMCAGSATGAEAGNARKRDTKPAAELFHDLFGPRLEEIERAFLAWLATL